MTKGISTIRKTVRPVTLALLPLLFVFMIEAPAIAQDRASGQGRIEHARWELVGTEVIITYDLIADADNVYDVNITLRRQSVESFGYVPKAVSGAVGKDQRAGQQKEIRWDFRKDVVEELKGDDYYFAFVVNVTGKEQSSNLLYYIVGGAGIVATVAAFLIFGKKAAASTGLPDPPVTRPTQ